VTTIPDLEVPVTTPLPNQLPYNPSRHHQQLRLL